MLLIGVTACGAPDETPVEEAPKTQTTTRGVGTFVRHLANASKNDPANSSVTISLTGSVKVHVGDTIIVGVHAGTNSPQTVSCSDTQGNTYTVDAIVGGNSQPLAFVCSSLITTELTRADTITATYPSFNGISLASANEYAGLSGVDRTAVAAGNSTTPNSGLTLTTNQADELVFGSITYDGNINFTPAAGFVEQGSTNFGGGGAKRSLSPIHRFVSSVGTYSASGTLTGAGGKWRAIVATYYVDNTAPVVTIDSVSPTVTNAGTTVTWQANEVGIYSIRRGADCATGTLIETADYFPPNSSHVTNIAAADLVAGSNNILVCVEDTGLNTGFASTTVTKDGTAPTVTINSVTPNPTSGDTVLTFTGSESGVYELRVGGTSCTTGTIVSSGAYTSGAFPLNVAAASLAEGANTLRVCLTDIATNVGSASTTVTKDTITPTVTIVSTVPSSTSNAAVVVTWRSNEVGTYEVRVGGTDCTTGTVVASAAYPTANANVATNIAASSFAQGSNTVRVCARDAALNTGSATTTVLRDSVLPVITAVSMSPNPTNAGASYTWNATENGSFTVRIGGTGCGSGTIIESGTYSTAPANYVTTIGAASLTPNSVNNVRVCLTDSFGNTGTRLTTVTHDSIAPVVTINSVSPSPTAAGTTVTWSGTENGTFSVRVGGTDCSTGTVVGSGSYSTAPATRNTVIAAGSLAEGANTLRVCISDAATNQGSASTTVTKDSTAPTVSIASASPNPTSGASTVTWSATENGTYSVRVGGTGCLDGTVADSGTYSTTPATVDSVVGAALLAEGSNTVRVCVADALGNTGSTTVVISKDATGPTVTAGCAAPTSGDAAVNFTATESGSFEVRVGSTGCSDGTVVDSGSYTSPASQDATIPEANLAEGTNTFRVCVTDGLGNTGSGTGTVVYRGTISVNLASASADRTFVGTSLAAEFGSMALGDVTGDGSLEFIAGERPGRDGTGALLRRTAGTVYGFAGGPGFFSGATTNVPTGALFRIVGGDTGDDLGVRNGGHLVAGVDVDGDGTGDLVISAAGADGVANARLGAGEVFVISGGTTLTGTINLAGDVLPTGVFSRIIGPVAGGVAQLLGVSDVTGDGVGDVLIGVPFASPGGRTSAGAVYLLQGGAGLAGTIDLATASPLAVFEGAAAGDQLGTSGDFGDIGGSAAVDVVLGAPFARASSGTAWAVFGPLSGTYDLASDSDARWESNFSARLGQGVEIAQVRGSARADVILSGRRVSSPAGVVVGGAVVFEGPVAAGAVTVDNPGSYGGAPAGVVGQDFDDNLGAAFSHGDLDGDGFDDLILGMYRADGAGNLIDAAGGGVVVLGGQCMGFTDLSTENAAYVVDGAFVGGHLGRFAEGVVSGDIDGDGNADFCLSSQIGGNGTAYCFSSPW